jgi:hypothetical protein
MNNRAVKVRSKVYVKFPKRGLGNMLLIWGRAFAFAHEHKLDMFIGKWWGVRWGVWFRKEKYKRLYWGYFKEDGILKRLQLFSYQLTATKVIEPKGCLKDIKGKNLFIFKEFESHGDYFQGLKPYRIEIKQALYDILSPAIIKQLGQYEKPVIGMHVRRGDFKYGSTITPLKFFVDAIVNIRSITFGQLPVTIFTDAMPEEISEVLELPFVKIAEAKADILDILLLSQSDICILSIGSTFSFWAAFLSDGIILKHPEEWHPEIRPAEVNKEFFEGFFTNEKIDDVLKQHLLKVASNINAIDHQQKLQTS